LFINYGGPKRLGHANIQPLFEEESMKKLFIIGFAALLLVAFTAPAMAKVKMGGIIFTDFYYVERDKNNSVAKGLTNPSNPDKYTITEIDTTGISRLNARWTNEDNVGMFIELGMGGARSGTGVSMRHGYGWWDINPAFTLMAGHSTTPFSQLNPSQLLGIHQGTIIGDGYGDWYSGRFAQIRGTWRFGKVGRLEVALVDQWKGNGGPWGTSYSEGGTDYQENTKLPRIDIGVPLHFGPVRLYPAILWSEKNVDENLSGVDNKIRIFAGALGAKAGFGPFGVALEGNWGKNMGNTGMGMGGSPSGSTFNTATIVNNNTIQDAETWSYWVDLSYKFGPVVPHFIFGQQKSSNKSAINQDQDVKTQMIGFSIPIDLAKGFRIRPEFMWYDDGKDKIGDSSTNMGKFGVYGVQFQITF
jgi:hypothetical protein